MAFSATNSISFSQLKNKLNGGISIKLSYYYQQTSFLPSDGSKYNGGFVGKWGGTGGGGSGFVGGCLLTTSGAPINPTTLSSSLNYPPPNNTDFHYISNIGIGGNGYIVIIFAN